MVDVRAGTVTQRVKVGDEPEGVTVSPDGKVGLRRLRGRPPVVGRRHHSFAITRPGSCWPAASLDRGHPGRQDAVFCHQRELVVDLVVFNAARLTLADTIRDCHEARRSRRTPPRRWARCCRRTRNCCSCRTAAPGQCLGIDVEKLDLALHARRRRLSGRGASASTPTAPGCSPPTVRRATSRSSTSRAGAVERASASAAARGASPSPPRLDPILRTAQRSTWSSIQMSLRDSLIGRSRCVAVMAMSIWTVRGVNWNCADRNDVTGKARRSACRSKY